MKKYLVVAALLVVVAGVVLADSGSLVEILDAFGW